jgi:nucleoside 2-deoxyribosyltransferase
VREPKVYLAGPEVFLPEAIEVGVLKKELCAKYGLKGLYPFDNEIPITDRNDQPDLLIYRMNVEMISDADCGVFNLTPFRGPSADVGTVFELGMCIALKKPAFAYTNEKADFLRRVKEFSETRREPSTGVWRDADSMAIEDFRNADNLMLEAALKDQGHRIIRHAAPVGKRFSDLTAFEKCLKLAAETFGLNRHLERRAIRAGG